MKRASEDDQSGGVGSSKPFSIQSNRDPGVQPQWKSGIQWPCRPALFDYCSSGFRTTTSSWHSVSVVSTWHRFRPIFKLVAKPGEQAPPPNWNLTAVAATSAWLKSQIELAAKPSLANNCVAGWGRGCGYYNGRAHVLYM